MDIHDIKRLPTQFDQVQSKGPANNSAQDVKVEPANSAETPQVEVPQQANANAANTEQPTEPPKSNEVAAAVEKLREHTQSLDRELHFQVDSDTGNTVVKIYDPATKEVVRQIPSEEVLELTKNLEEAQGVIFNSRA